MHPDTLKVLNLMFKENESICVSDSQFAYHSMELKTMESDKIPLLSRNSTIPLKYVDNNKIVLVALNPIKGYRSDEACYKYRNLLVELDIGTQEEQIEYIQRIQMPYSAMIWSGSKSIHTLISLNEDLPNEAIYRKLYKWTLNIASLSDQALGNPSRSIRLAGAIRPETGKEQKLLELKGQVKLADFADWLAKHPNAKPQDRPIKPKSERANYDRISPWAKERLRIGLDPTQGRNRQWFALAVEFSLAGYSFDDTVEILSTFFHEERDFKEKEWLNTLKSGFAYADKK